MSRLLIAVLIGIAPVSVANAQTPLTGVDKATVDVWVGGSAAAASGVTKPRLQTLTELRARSAGLRVLTPEEDRQDPAINPVIAVELAIISNETESGSRRLGYTLGYTIAMREWRVSPRNGAVVAMELWRNGGLSTTNPDNAAERADQVLGRFVDELLNEWLKANPRR